MSFEGEQRSRPEPPRARRTAPPPPRKRTRKSRVMRQRAAALARLLGVAVVLIAIIRSSSSSARRQGELDCCGHASALVHSVDASKSPTTASSGPGNASVPILVYHVINAQPTQSSADPALYVPVDEFSSQMQALKSAGWHAVTLNQVAAYWARGTSLGSGKPIVITFDNGYASHYLNALPVLKRLGWVGVENLPVTGLPPSDGGLSDTQVRA